MLKYLRSPDAPGYVAVGCDAEPKKLFLQFVILHSLGHGLFEGLGELLFGASAFIADELRPHHYCGTAGSLRE
jgi:hypothetical protein